MTTLVCVQTGEEIPYKIVDGFSLNETVNLETDWHEEKLRIFEQLMHEHPEAVEDPESNFHLFDEYQLSDYHWSWANKAICMRSKEYFWFYLTAEGKVQAACVIKHPKSSRIDNKGIFYIDYLAVAYWNRNRAGYTRRFKSVGTILITHAINYSMNVLGYRPGFSLHSLPSAESYYQRLQMTDYGNDPDYHGLKYFEAPEPLARSIAQGAPA